MQPTLKERLLSLPGSRGLPCVRGRTVVPESCADTVIVGYPNHLGVFDDARGDRTIVLTGRWSGLRPAPKDATVVALEETAPATVAAEALFEVRHLAKRLRQLRGVQLPIRPQSPIIVALLTFSSRSDARALPGLTTLEGDFPEYPGGIRIELPIDAIGFDATRYAASLERMIMEEE